MKRKSISLDSQTKKRILELLAVRQLLLRHRNSNLGRVATLFYGIAIGSGYLLIMGILKTNGFDFAIVLLWVVASSWLIATWLSEVEKKKPVKIKIR